MSKALSFPAPRVSRKEMILNRVLWTVICFLFLFILAEISFHFIISPRLVIKNIIVRSDIPLSKEEVFSIAGIREKEYYFSLRLEEIKERLIAYPLIRKADLEKIFPDTLKLTLYGREPLVIALVDVPGRTVPVAIDEEGVLFQIGSAITDWELPVISGLKFQNLRAGMELPEMLKPFFSSLNSLRKASPDLFRLISEVKIIPKTGTDYELLLWFILYPVSLRFGRNINSSNLKNAVMILDLIRQEDFSAKVKELDLRTGEVVYRVQED